MEALLFAAVPLLSYIPVASLAAVLVFTGWKLAYPKAVPDLLKFGKSEVAIYLITIVVIVASNLLEGVLVGLALSILKLLQAFSHLEIKWDEDIVRNRVQLHLKGAATLIRLPQLAAALEQVRPGAEVHVHFEHLDYIDHACLDLMSNWKSSMRSPAGRWSSVEELSHKYHRRRTGAQRGMVRW
jgi:MFS superfamily sulfate permease-like transporter